MPLSSCTQTFFAKCNLGVVATVRHNSTLPALYADGGEASCVPIDCYRGDQCGAGSGGTCALANLSRIDEHALLPDIYEGGPLKVQCADGTGAVAAIQPFASCSDVFEHTYTCNDCVWKATSAKACKPRMCDTIDITGVAKVSPEDSFTLWPPRLKTGRSVTVECVEVREICSMYFFLILSTG